MIPGIVSILTKLKAFIDNFNRTDNPSSLAGASSPTNKWTTFRGVWGISSNRANTPIAANSYPMAGIKTGAKTARIKIDNGVSTTCGYGISFWITDSNNWYGLYADRTYEQTGPFFFPCCPSGYYNANCGGVCTQNGFGAPWPGDPGHFCATCGCGGCASQLSGPVGCGCQGTGPGCINLPGWTLCSSNYLGNGQDECCLCGSPAPFTTCSVYADNYYHFARLMTMSSGTASIINSRLFATTSSPSNNISQLQVETNTTSNNSVRTSASLDGGAASTAVVAITSPTQTGTHGIMIAPRSSGTNAPTQSTSVDNFDYTPL